jgi:hypothetical protein
MRQKGAVSGLLIASLTAFTLSVPAQRYTFPNIGQPEAQRIGAVVDTVFAGISRGHVSPELVSGKQKELTREMLEYLKNRQGEDETRQIVNCYPLDTQVYRVMVACSKTDTLRQIYTFDIRLLQGQATIDLPLWHDTRNWPVKQAGTIRYYYDHDFDPDAARDFDEANQRIAKKLGLQADTFDFYLSDNYQQTMQWMGLTYDSQYPGETREGFNIEQTIFAIQHNEDYSHDLVHYYVYKVRKGPRNPYAEEGVAYYWGNAYYPDPQGHMITLERLKTDLRKYLAVHPGVDLLAFFRQNERGVFGPAKEVSVRSTLSGVIAEYIEKKYGAGGVLQLLNCGASEANYFAVTESLAGVNAANFNTRIRELLGAGGPPE